MRKQNRWVIWFIILLLLVTLACRTLMGDDDSGSDDSAVVEPTAVNSTDDGTSLIETATPVPDLEPTDEPPAEEPGSDEPSGDNGEAPPSLDLSQPGVFQQPEDFASFGISMVITFDGVAEDGSAQSGRIELEGVRVIDPPATSMTISVEGGDEQIPFDSFTMYEIENTTYLSLPDGTCIGGDSTGMADSFDELVEIQDFLDEEVELIESGVMVNGVLADRYAIDLNNLDQWQTVEGGFSEIEEASIAVAREGSYVVQVVVDGTGQGGFFDSGSDTQEDIRYEFNLVPSNDVIDIAIPDGCSGSTSGESGYPMMADAYQVNSFGGLLTYMSDTPVNEVADYYRQAMPEEGWSTGDEFAIEELVTLEFTRDGTTAQITIVADNASGATIVTILSE